MQNFYGAYRINFYHVIETPAICSYKGEAPVFQESFCNLKNSVCHLLDYIMKIMLSDAESREHMRSTIQPNVAS